MFAYLLTKMTRKNNIMEMELRSVGNSLNELVLAQSEQVLLRSFFMDDVIKIYVGHGQYALVNYSDYNLVCGYWWRINGSNNTKYAVTHSTHDKKTRKTISMHRLIMGPDSDLCVDHINRNGLDNRRENLRLVTKQQNSFNAKQNNSRFKGVSYRKDTNKYRAYISLDGKRRWLGNFHTPHDAATAYDLEAIKLFGEHAYLNFPMIAASKGD